MLMQRMVLSSGRNDEGSRMVRLMVSAMRPERVRFSTRKAHSPTATNNRMERPPLSPDRGTFDRLTDGLDPKHT